MHIRYFELADGGECAVEIPYASTFVFTHRRKRHAVDYEDHNAAIEAYFNKLKVLIDEEAIELTPWVLFASKTHRYHVRLPTTKRFTRIDLSSSRRTSKAYDSVRQALDAYNAWMGKQHKQGLRHVPASWEELAKHPESPWVERSDGRYYFSLSNDPSLEFGPEMHLHSNGLCKSAMFQVASMCDGARLSYNDEGCWTNLDLWINGKSQGASLVMLPDCTVVQLKHKSAKEARTTGMWLLCEEAARKIDEWTFDGYDPEGQRHGEWWMFADSGDRIKLIYEHGRLTHKFLYSAQDQSLIQETAFNEDGTHVLNHYCEGGQVADLKQTINAQGDPLSQEVFHEDGSFWNKETCVYSEEDGHLLSKAIINESNDQPGALQHTAITYDLDGTKTSFNQSTYPQMCCIYRWHMSADGHKHTERFYDDGQTTSRSFSKGTHGRFVGHFDVFFESGARGKRFMFDDVDPHTASTLPTPVFEFIKVDAPDCVEHIQLPTCKGDVPKHRRACNAVLKRFGALNARGFVLAGPWIELEHHSHLYVTRLRVPVSVTLECTHVIGQEFTPQPTQTFDTTHLARVAYNTQLMALMDDGWSHVCPQPPMLQWPHPGPDFALLDYTPASDPVMTRRLGYISRDELSDECFYGPYREWFHDGGVIDVTELYDVEIGWKIAYSASGIITSAHSVLRDEVEGWGMNFDIQGCIHVAIHHHQGDKLSIWGSGARNEEASDEESDEQVSDVQGFDSVEVNDPAHPEWATCVTYFHADGVTPQKRGHMDRNNRAQGRWQFFDEAGNVDHTTGFKDNIPVFGMEFDLEGDVLKETVFSEGRECIFERTPLGALERTNERPKRTPDLLFDDDIDDALCLWFSDGSNRLEAAGFSDKDTYYAYSTSVWGPAKHDRLNFKRGFGMVRELCQLAQYTPARWLNLCELVERLYALHPTTFVTQMLPYIVDHVSTWPTSYRMAPWLWINKFIVHALPVEALHMLSALSLSAATNAPDYHSERTPLLISWLACLPEDAPALDGLHVSFRNEVIQALVEANRREPDPRFHAETDDSSVFRLEHGTLDSILGSRIARRLRVLDLSHSLPLWDYYTGDQGATDGRTANLDRVSKALQAPESIEVLDLGGNNFEYSVSCTVMPHLKSLNVGQANPLGSVQIKGLNKATPALESLNLVPHCIGWLLGNELPEEDDDEARNISRYWSVFVYDFELDNGDHEMDEQALKALLETHPSLKRLEIQSHYEQRASLREAATSHPDLLISYHKAHSELHESFPSDWDVHFNVEP